MAGQNSHTRRFDQAQRLRELMARNGPMGVRSSSSTHILAVVSGKGGVGKTLIASNLSIALAARGHRVILFDMDMGLANADIVLGVESPCTWSDVLSGRRDLEDVIVPGPGEIAFVPGVSGVARMANLSEFERHQLAAAMERIEQRYEVVVLDCGAGISENVVGFASSADTVLVVSTPEPTAVTDAYAMIKALAQDQARRTHVRDSGMSIGVLVNMVSSRREGRSTFDRLAGVAARFLHLPLSDYGYVLSDEHVPAAVRQRCPVVLRYPRCSASTCVMASAARLAREMGRPEADQSLFYRVMNMFL
jgi:flagellar biosynthesis protein FlhG